MALSRTNIWTTLGVGSLLLFSAANAFSQPNNSGANKRVFVSTPSKEVSRLVSDCMTPRSKMRVLHPDATSDEAIALLLKTGFSGCPVVHPINGKLMGIISSSDFMFKDIYAGALLNMEGSDEHLSDVVGMAQKIVGSTVGELMSHHVVTIRADEPMAHAADRMARGNLHRLLVVDPADEDALVGILTRSDVMRDVMTTVKAALPEKATFYDVDIDVEAEGIDVEGVRP